LEQMRLIRRAWLYGILLVQWLGWQLCGDRYWSLSVGLDNHTKTPSHPSWLSGIPKVWKISWWELTSPLDLPTMVSVKNVIRDDVWRAKTSNAHTNSAAHIQEKNSSYSAMPTARQKILSTSWNVQFVAFNTLKKLNNNLVNAWIATGAMPIANLTYWFHSLIRS
jgi:D-ribose pyranose/furanose isomerase RbsD